MALDFPASPSVGQKYPASPLAGIPTYTWDGEKWTTQGGSIVSASPGTALPLMNAKPALVGVSTNFSREDHVHPVDTSRAPFDAMAYSGLQINGAMEVSQERGGAATVSSTAVQYVCDGWAITKNGSMATSASIGNIGLSSVGFPSGLGMTVTTAQASLGAGDYSFIWQNIEGYRIARLGWGTANAQPITISFWSMHHRAGAYCIAARNGATNRSYIATYTQNVADVPQYNTVTIPGDTSGTWPTDNTSGLQIAFAQAIGATFIGSAANTWLTGNYLAVAGQINAVAAITDVFRLTGVIILPGNEAPSAARSPFVMRSYDQELMLCQRYLWRWAGGTPARVALGYADTTSTVQAAFYLPVPMRAGPTLLATNLTGNGIPLSGSALFTNSTIVWVSFSSGGGFTANGVTQIYASGSGVLQLDARL